MLFSCGGRVRIRSFYMSTKVLSDEDLLWQQQYTVVEVAHLAHEELCGDRGNVSWDDGIMQAVIKTFQPAASVGIRSGWREKRDISGLMQVMDLLGARSRDRTGMTLRSRDFKSLLN